MFRSSGYDVVATSRTRDNGIDLFIGQKTDGTRKGVQVKRYKDKITAETIRSFAGSLLLHGLTSGVFVTTSDYTVDARKTADIYQSLRGCGLELLDAVRLYDLLKIGLGPAYPEEIDESCPFFSPLEKARGAGNHSRVRDGSNPDLGTPLAHHPLHNKPKRAEGPNRILHAAPNPAAIPRGSGRASSRLCGAPSPAYLVVFPESFRRSARSCCHSLSMISTVKRAPNAAQSVRATSCPSFSALLNSMFPYIGNRKNHSKKK